MNKADIVNQMAEDAGISKRQATAALDSIVEGITKTLRSGKKVTLVGFGTFTVVKRAARKGRNPATGEAIKIKAKKVAKFRAGYELQAKL
jgi:DNA-binding protein HU-beta